MVNEYACRQRWQATLGRTVSMAPLNRSRQRAQVISTMLPMDFVDIDDEAGIRHGYVTKLSMAVPSRLGFRRSSETGAARPAAG
jgi:hypothetical protein